MLTKNESFKFHWGRHKSDSFSRLSIDMVVAKKTSLIQVSRDIRNKCNSIDKFIILICKCNDGRFFIMELLLNGLILRII
jgi:hypothetical protein